MSRHFIHLEYCQRKITVVAGYDRPLRQLFLHVLYADLAPREDEQFVYDSLLEPKLDWTDINTVADKLATLGIEVPTGMIEQIYLDQCANAGNREVEHHTDRPPTPVHTG